MRRPALAAGALTMLMAAGCATQEPPPTCPQAALRRAVCADGRKLITYDTALELPAFCEALEPGRRPPQRRPDVPLLDLAEGVRALELASGEWLLLGRERNLGDAPDELARWWRTGRCVPPPRSAS